MCLNESQRSCCLSVAPGQTEASSTPVVSLGIDFPSGGCLSERKAFRHVVEVEEVCVCSEDLSWAMGDVYCIWEIKEHMDEWIPC